jgi:hypothetical protein
MLTPCVSQDCTSQDVQHIGRSDHLPVSVDIQRPGTAPPPGSAALLLQCPPVLKWRGPERLYSDIEVQHAITAGEMQAALALLSEQGPAAATAALLEVVRESALAVGQPLLRRCCPQPRIPLV